MTAKRLREFEMDDDAYIDPLEEELLDLPREARARLAEALFSSFRDDGDPRPFPVDQALADLYTTIPPGPSGRYIRNDGDLREKRLESRLLASATVTREVLANRLLSSLKAQDEIDAEWAEELERRYQRYLSGESKGYSAEEVMAEARARLRR